MDTVVVLRRCVNHPVTGDEYWEYWWEHPAGMFWNLDEVLCSLGVPDELLSDLLECLGPSSKLYRTLNNLAWSSSERVRLRVQVADAPPDWEPPAGWESISMPRDEYLYLWRVVRPPETDALQAAVQAASKAVEEWRRYGGWL